MPLVTRAQRKECDQIFELVNQAFKIEIGKSGLAYKKCDKYRLKDEARKHLDDMFVVKEGRKVRKYCIVGVGPNLNHVALQIYFHVILDILQLRARQ